VVQKNLNGTVEVVIPSKDWTTHPVDRENEE